MSTADRQILTPGDTAPPPAAAAADAAPAPERKKPGPKPRAAAAPAPDLDDYDSETLPPAPAAAANPAGFTPEQQRLITAMIAQAVAASKSAQDPATAAKLAAKANTPDKLPSQSEAAVMCNDQVVRGLRPRPVLTPDGWYVHPESARVLDAGLAKLTLAG